MAEMTKEQAAFLETFDWHNFEEEINKVDENELKEFNRLIESTIVASDDANLLEGIVVRITDRDAIVDINAKSEGVISLNEFRYNPNLKVGDKVEVMIDIKEDKSKPFFKPESSNVLIPEEASNIDAHFKSCLNKQCLYGLPKDAKFCLKCGTAQLSQFCTECGYNFPGMEKFCPDCGTKR
jgi:RNA polymerase subunit RPABC4/transcription elongation factor Spt4